MIDWAAIQPFGESEQGATPEVRLRTTNEELHRLRPGELADLLEDLAARAPGAAGRPEPEEAADALEEMEPEELPPCCGRRTGRAAELVADMEPDEAVDALRDLDSDEREELRGHAAGQATRPESGCSTTPRTRPAAS